MSTSPLRMILLAAAPAVWLTIAHPSIARSAGLVAGVALVTWASLRFTARTRPQRHPASYARTSTLRRRRRLARRPAGRGQRDVRCPAGRTPQRHAARRPIDR